MAEQNEGADKTEKPTSKKLKDARKEGNVAKSRELTSTVLIMGWLAGGWRSMCVSMGRRRHSSTGSLRPSSLARMLRATRSPVS